MESSSKLISPVWQISFFFWVRRWGQSVIMLTRFLWVWSSILGCPYLLLSFSLKWLLLLSWFLYMRGLRLRDTVTGPKSHSRYVRELKKHFLQRRHWINEHISDGSPSSSSWTHMRVSSCIPGPFRNTGMCDLKLNRITISFIVWILKLWHKIRLACKRELWIWKGNSHMYYFKLSLSCKAILKTNCQNRITSMP